MGRRTEAIVPLAGGVLAFTVATIVIHPFTTAPLSFDTAASVAYFERIVSGRHLEAFVTTTPKPLLTVLYGLAYTITGDWRAISWLAIVAMAGAVSAAAALAQRSAGPVAGAFCAVALAGAPSLIWDAALGGGVPWAVLLLAGAGLAMTRRPRHPGIAGVLLMLATLARLEVLVVTGAALVCLAVVEVGPRLGRGLAHRGDWLLALGIGALPIMLAHDWVLTGDPLFWTQPSAATSVSSPQAVMTPYQVVVLLGARYEAVWPLSGLALVGGIGLVLRRRWVVAIGLAASSVGMAAFLLSLAVRRIYVSARYPELIDIAVAFAAAIGFALLATAMTGGLVRRSLRWWSRAALALAIAASVPGAVVASNGWGPWDRRLLAQVGDARLLIAHFDRVKPTLAAATTPLLSPAQRAVSGDYRFRASLPPARLAVPILARPYAAVSLGLPLWAVAAPPDLRDPATASVRTVMVVYHDRLVDRAARRPAGFFAAYETLTPRRIGAVEVTPIYVDPAAGLYVDLLTPVHP